MSKTDASRLKILEELFAAFNRHDADAVMACFHPDVVFDAAAGPESVGRRIIGAEAVRQAFETTWTVMPDVSWQVHRHAVFGERAISEWRFSAGVLMQGRIEADGVDLFTFEGEMIISKSAYRKDRPVQPTA